MNKIFIFSLVLTQALFSQNETPIEVRKAFDKEEIHKQISLIRDYVATVKDYVAEIQAKVDPKQINQLSPEQRETKLKELEMQPMQIKQNLVRDGRNLLNKAFFALENLLLDVEQEIVDVEKYIREQNRLLVEASVHDNLPEIADIEEALAIAEMQKEDLTTALQILKIQIQEVKQYSLTALDLSYFDLIIYLYRPDQERLQELRKTLDEIIGKLEEVTKRQDLKLTRQDF